MGSKERLTVLSAINSNSEETVVPNFGDHTKSVQLIMEDNRTARASGLASKFKYTNMALSDTN